MIPLDIFDGCTAILGRTGAGKSWAARGFVEGWLSQGRRVCVIDPIGVWYGLRSNVAGDGPGFPVVVFGGDHGDVPIGERSGERIAQIIAERNMPAVICTAEMTGGERHRFMGDFLGTLYRANRKPLHLVIDEADEIAPQQPLPENRRLLGDVDRIVRRGRVRGFRVLLISQRPAVLNKNCLSMAGVLVAMRMPGPQDRKAIDAWITGQAAGDEAATVMSTLPGLQRGEGWVWAPESGILERMKFPAITTFDSMRTPEIGEDVSEPTGLAQVELGDLRALLSAEDGTTNELAKSDVADLKTAEQRGYERGRVDGRLEGMNEALAATVSWRNEIAVAARTLAAKAEATVGDKRPTDQTASAPASAATAVGETVHAATPMPPKRKHAVEAPQTVSDGTLPLAANKLLTVLARGIILTWVQAATLAGIKARGGSFNTARKALRDGGYIIEDEIGITLSAKSRTIVGVSAPAPLSQEERLTWWKAALPTTPGRVLDHLHQQGKWTQRDQLADSLGVAARGGSWNTALSILRANRLIEVKGDLLRSMLDA